MDVTVLKQMMHSLQRLGWSFVVLIILGGCTLQKEESSFAHSFFQTTGAAEFREDINDLDGLLEQYRVKLNKRNPGAFAPLLQPQIQNAVLEGADIVTLHLESEAGIPEYKQYLKKAFDPAFVPNRNDYLILGIHKMLYYAYERDDFHKLTAIQYETENLQELNHTLQAIQWKIKHARDEHGNYLFLTWQQNWQIELQKRLARGEMLSAELIVDLAYIKEGRETILGSSNNTFETITSTMIYIVGKTIKTLGGEPTLLGVQSLKSFILFF